MHRLNQYIALLVLLWFAGNSDPAAAGDIGQAAPQFAAPDLSGAPIDTGKLRGKVVIIHFWATWCPNCRTEMPLLDAFYIQHRSQAVEVIGITLDRLRTRDQVIEYMHAYHFPAAFVSDATKNTFDTPGTLPVTYIIDKAGILKSVLRPDTMPVTDKNLSEMVESLLKR